MNKNLWSSRLNFILATTGAAVGMGSIWKFPYMAGDNGGAAFVLFYIFATFLIAVPIMCAEIVIGKIARANPIQAMKNLAIEENKTKHWGLIGLMGAIALVLVLAFYSVIGGWSIAYMVKIWSNQYANLTNLDIKVAWNNFMGNPIELLIWHSIFMFLTLWIVAKGIHKGIEKASKIMIPGLLIVLIFLMSYSAYVGDFHSAVIFLFKADFSKLTPHIMIDALGQAAFTLAIGAGCMIVYGSYVQQKTIIFNNVLIIASLTIIVSILSGLAIFPIVFEFNLPQQDGPGLMFQVLPLAFNQMPLGTFFGGLFFLMLFFAGWTSSISMAEPLVVILMEHFKITRNKASIIIGFCSWTLGIFALLSFNILSDIKIFGKYNIFSAMTDLCTNIFLPIGAFAFAIFVGWILNKSKTKEALQIKSNVVFNILLFLIKYISPLGILFVFLLQ